MNGSRDGLIERIKNNSLTQNQKHWLPQIIAYINGGKTYMKPTSNGYWSRIHAPNFGSPPARWEYKVE